MVQGDDSWGRVRSVFDRAVGASSDERARILAGEPEAVRREVERLLELDGRVSAFPEHARAIEAAGTGPTLQAGERVGPYLLLGPLGAGGMGVVFEAEQERPRRRVALKTVRPELATDELLRRFHNEVQLLGQLEHPGIARIYDAGVFARDGRETPYYAMELVEGARTLLAYAEERQLTQRTRLELFSATCAAVEYGHRKGVIHRDLKPGNVLVDAHGRVKIIDFGLARPSDPETLGVSAVETRRGDIFGTLPYMSPEHVSGRSFAIDTRSDVYSLGCILCELLTGRPPHDLSSSSMREALQRIETEEPRPPQGIERELGWIVQRATARDPGRRYPGAAELALDVERFLRREPLSAGPPSRWYATRSFVRRYRAPLVAVGAVMAALSIGLARAEQSARVATRAGGIAEFEAGVASRVNSFLASLFTSMNAYRAGGDARVRDVLEACDQGLADFDDPATRAILTGIVGEGFLNLGQMERAGERLQEAFELANEHLDARSPYALHIAVIWADWLEQTGRLRESSELSRTVLPVMIEELGAQAEDTLYLRNNLAVCASKLGDAAEAEHIYRELLALGIEREGEPSWMVAHLLHLLGGTVAAQGRLEEARELTEAAHEMSVEVNGEEDLLTMTLLMALGSLAFQEGDPAGAEALLRDALEGYERLAGTLSNRVDVRLRLVEVLFGQERLDEGASLLEECGRLLAPEPGTNRHHARRALLVARFELERGDLDGAEAAARGAIELAEQVFGAVSPKLRDSRALLDEVLAAQRGE